MSADGVPLIESQTDLEALFARLRSAPLLAVDTEAASFHRFIDRVYLLQISSRNETAVVDPLAVESLAPLSLVLADPEVEIVFHDADYDLRLLDREYGFRATGVFDTRIAAQLLNEPGVGLAALLEKYMGVRLDKRFQRADWSARPLSPKCSSTRPRTRGTCPRSGTSSRRSSRRAAGSAGPRRSSRCWTISAGVRRTGSPDISGSRAPRRSRAESSRFSGSCTSGARGWPSEATGPPSGSSTTSRC